MKKVTPARLLCSLLAVLTIGTVSAQSSPQLMTTAFHDKRPAKTVRAPDKVPASVVVTPRVLRSFEQAFPNTPNVIWKEFDTNVGATFRAGDRRTVALFHKNGRLLHAIFYGTEKHLPDLEKRLIHFEYPGHEITVTQEVTVNEKHLWLATVQNDREFIQLRVIDGELEEVERFNRAKQ